MPCAKGKRQNTVIVAVCSEALAVPILTLIAEKVYANEPQIDAKRISAANDLATTVETRLSILKVVERGVTIREITMRLFMHGTLTSVIYHYTYHALRARQTEHRLCPQNYQPQFSQDGQSTYQRPRVCDTLERMNFVIKGTINSAPVLTIPVPILSMYAIYGRSKDILQFPTQVNRTLCQQHVLAEPNIGLLVPRLLLPVPRPVFVLHFPMCTASGS